MKGKKIVKLGISCLFMLCSLYYVNVAYGEDAAVSLKGNRKAAFQACATDIGIQLPVPGSPHTPLDPQTKEKLGQCMADKGFSMPKHHHHKKFHKAMQACLSNAGITMPAHQPGVRPVLDDKTKAAVDSCRAQVKADFEKNKQSASSAG
jgi:hypothetical protein